MRIPNDTKVIISKNAPFHAGKVGWVDFYGEGPSSSTVVLRTVPEPEKAEVLIAVSCKHIMKLGG